MYKFTQEIIKASRKQNIIENAVLSQNDTAKKMILGTKIIADELKKNQPDLESNKGGLDGVTPKTTFNLIKQKKAFSENHNDEKFLEFLTQKDDSYYSKSKIDYNKDSIFQELKNFKLILEQDKILSKVVFLSKEIALFYTNENKHNSEMYVQRFNENPDIFIRNNMSAEKILSFIEITGYPYKPYTLV